MSDKAANRNPKVSVLMPVYNAAPYLAEAIDSILGQTFADFEFLIINDGSVDGSEEIIRSYNDPRLRYLRNERNLGLVDTLNRSIELARGEYIARMDADDISLPQRFERQVAFMDQHPELGACGTAFQFFGDSDVLMVLPDNQRQAFTLLSETSCLGHPTSMIRKEILDQFAIRYERAYEYAADYAFWIRISQVSGLASLPEMLLLYRWHTTNMSRIDPSRVEAKAKAQMLWYEYMLERPLSQPQEAYLRRGLRDRATFAVGKIMLLSILTGKNASRINAKQFGEITVTEWEQNYIARFGLPGLLTCLLQPAFRKWSRATPVGLVAYYLTRLGIQLR